MCFMMLIALYLKPRLSLHRSSPFAPTLGPVNPAGRALAAAIRISIGVALMGIWAFPAQASQYSHSGEPKLANSEIERDAKKDHVSVALEEALFHINEDVSQLGRPSPQHWRLIKGALNSRNKFSRLDAEGFLHDLGHTALRAYALQVATRMMSSPLEEEKESALSEYYLLEGPNRDRILDAAIHGQDRQLRNYALWYRKALKVRAALHGVNSSPRQIIGR